MSRDDFEQLKDGTFKRKVRRRLGLFVDGVGLDRATRRLERKVDLGRLVQGLCSGLKPEVARYYTLIPYEDDARQFAFLDAVERAGLKVIVKRLPPKGVKRQVSMDVHIAADLIGYSVGLFDDSSVEKSLESVQTIKNVSNGVAIAEPESSVAIESGIRTLSTAGVPPRDNAARYLATVVCPSRELSYAIDMSHRMNVEISLSDFGLYGSSDGWKGVDRWIDLSTSETIWRD